MDKAGEEDDGGSERVVDQELAEPERCFRAGEIVSPGFPTGSISRQAVQQLTTKGLQAGAFDEVDGERKEHGDEAGEPTRLSVARIKLVHKKFDALLYIDDTDICM